VTIEREIAKPMVVDSFAILDHVSQTLAIDAARVAAEARAAGAVETRRTTLPYRGGWMRLMAGAVPSLGVFGYKEFHLSPDNSVRYAVHLFELDNGRPIGVVDAALVTTLRTAATAAVATERFFGRDAEVELAVIGSGAEAMAGVRALHSVLRLTGVRVTSRSVENREKFAAAVGEELGLAVTTAAHAREAVDGAGMAYIATASGGRVVVSLSDLGDLPFLASIGSTLPGQRELDADVLVGASRVVVDTWDVLDESGDALAAAEAGLQRQNVQILGDFLVGDAVTDGLTVYKSIGSPEQDLVLAHAILGAAAAEGFGRPLDPLSAVKRNL
jgi:ornithine cyclodeaminase/alanine dehydrogenase-like protein (mu-crystallin family)